MKKILAMLFMAALPAFFLTSCSDDDDDPTLADYASGTYEVEVDVNLDVPGPKLSLKEGEEAQEKFELVLTAASDNAVNMKITGNYLPDTGEEGGEARVDSEAVQLEVTISNVTLTAGSDNTILMDDESATIAVKVNGASVSVLDGDTPLRGTIADTKTIDLKLRPTIKIESEGGEDKIFSAEITLKGDKKMK